MKISFLIPALNEENNIGRCIDSILQNFPRLCDFEIILGDHGSTDETIKIAETCGARVARFSGGTVGALRNRLVGVSSGELLVFLDADVALTNEWGRAFKLHFDYLHHHPEEITGSFCVVPDVDNIFIRYWFSKIPVKKSNYLGTGHMIIFRELFERMGGFTAELVSGEDFDLCQRAQSLGAKIVARPELKAIHYDYPGSIREFVLRERWHGQGDFQSVRRFLESKVALVTMLFVMLVLAGFWAVATWAAGLPVILILLIALLVVVSATKFPRLNGRDRGWNILIVFLYFIGRSAALLSVLKSRFF